MELTHQMEGDDDLGQVKVDVEAVDQGIGQGRSDWMQLTHQMEGDDDLGVLNLVLQNVDQVVGFPWVPRQCDAIREKAIEVRLRNDEAVFAMCLPRQLLLPKPLGLLASHRATSS